MRQFFKSLRPFIFLAGLLVLPVIICFAQITPPYFDDFEGGNAGWTVDSVSGSTWELGTPVTAPTNSTHSGVNAWDVDLLNPYLPSTECYLISPVFDFSNAASYNSTVSFWQNRDTENGWDGARLDYSTNGGSNWTVLGTIGDPKGVNWYNGLSFPGNVAWVDNSNGWIFSSYELGVLNGSSTVTFRFSFSSDPDIMEIGFTMDDFAVTTATGTGIDDQLNNNSIMVYPNPASDKIQIISAKAEGDLLVYDVYGKQVWSEKMNSRQTELTVKYWKAGVYFLTLKTKDSLVTQRIVVIK